MQNDPRAIRSLVFLPAHDPELIREHAEYGMDGICLDLEDLTPMDQKEQARRIYPEIAKELNARGIAAFARTNTLASGMAGPDLEAIVCPELHCVSIPKVETGAEVNEFCALLEAAEKKNGVPVGHTLVRPIVETARAVRNAYEIAAASSRIAYMGGVAGGWWGDLATSIGYTPSADGRETFYLRSKVLIDVRAADVPFPIGGVAAARRDPEGIREFAQENKYLGYHGMHCMSTAEIVQVVNEVFSPTPEEIDRWKVMLPRLEKAERDGIVASRMDGETVDTVGLQRLHQQLALARRLGLTD